MKISYGSNVYGAKEIKEVVKQLKTGTQMGKSVENFENKISKLFRKKKNLTCKLWKLCINSFISIIRF